MYHSQLSACIKQFLDKDESLVKYVFNYYLRINTHKNLGIIRHDQILAYH